MHNRSGDGIAGWGKNNIDQPANTEKNLSVR